MYQWPVKRRNSIHEIAVVVTDEDKTSRLFGGDGNRPAPARGSDSASGERQRETRDFRESACALVDLEHRDIVMSGIEDEDKPTLAVDSDEPPSRSLVKG